MRLLLIHPSPSSAASPHWRLLSKQYLIVSQESKCWESSLRLLPLSLLIDLKYPWCLILLSFLSGAVRPSTSKQLLMPPVELCHHPVQANTPCGLPPYSLVQSEHMHSHSHSLSLSRLSIPWAYTFFFWFSSTLTKQFLSFSVEVVRVEYN